MFAIPLPIPVVNLSSLLSEQLLVTAGAYVASAPSGATAALVEIVGGGGNITSASGTGGAAGAYSSKVFKGSGAWSVSGTVGAAGGASTATVGADTITAGGATTSTGGTASGGDVNISGGTPTGSTARQYSPGVNAPLLANYGKGANAAYDSGTTTYVTHGAATGGAVKITWFK